MNDNELADIISNIMSRTDLSITLWDVGHGLAIWIKTPNGHNHLIDAGTNDEFCPARHLRENYGETELDYLIISHPDMDHIQGLPGVVEHLGQPRILLRNKSLPSDEKFGGATKAYQQTFKSLDTRYTSPVEDSKDPSNPEYNGGVTVKHGCVTYEQGMSKNNTSMVVFYAYAGWLFVFPGDIEDSGWQKLWAEKSASFEPLIKAAKYKVLVSPHHGRSSAYSEEMMKAIEPNLILISDKYGKEPTDPRYYTRASGLTINDEHTKYFTTKSGGRIKFTISSEGKYTFNQLTLEQAKNQTA